MYILLLLIVILFQDEFISFLNSTKAHVQKECEILSDLKFELGKFVEKLTVEDNEVKKARYILLNIVTVKVNIIKYQLFFYLLREHIFYNIFPLSFKEYIFLR